MAASPSDYNARIIAEFRTNAGHVGGPFENSQLLLLHHTGAKSGAPRINPVAYHRDEGRYVIVASKGGAPTNPAWYYNLKAHPEVEIEVGTDSIAAIANEVTGEERERLFRERVAISPAFAQYQTKTDRVIPVFVLTPKAGS
jgi:deazaflavin-dependent oxidoreductase (nitroreductase family)